MKKVIASLLFFSATFSICSDIEELRKECIEYHAERTVEAFVAFQKNRHTHTRALSTPRFLELVGDMTDTVLLIDPSDTKENRPVSVATLLSIHPLIEELLPSMRAVGTFHDDHDKQEVKACFYALVQTGLRQRPHSVSSTHCISPAFKNDKNTTEFEALFNETTEDYGEPHTLQKYHSSSSLRTSRPLTPRQ